jgi:hypothetical protein
MYHKHLNFLLHLLVSTVFKAPASCYWSKGQGLCKRVEAQSKVQLLFQVDGAGREAIWPRTVQSRWEAKVKCADACCICYECTYFRRKDCRKTGKLSAYSPIQSSRHNAAAL